MTAVDPNLSEMPQIGNSQIGLNPISNSNIMRKPDISMFDNAPSDVTAGSFFGKILLGIIVGICVAFLLLGSLSIGGMTGPADGSLNSMLGILLPVIGFVVGLVGNLALAGLYNVFYSKRYYSFGKMAGLIFASSLIIFIFFFIPYLLYQGMYPLYTLLGFQIIFELFVAKNLIDFLSQPNYSASSFIGNTLGAVLSVVVHLVIVSQMSADNVKLEFIVASAVIAYVMTAIGSGIWDAIYYKFYEWGNNPFYLPSLNELREERRKEEVKKEKEEEDVNVDMK